MADIFNRFLFTSDPVISKLRSPIIKNSKVEVPEDVKNLYKMQEQEVSDDENSEDSDDELI